VLSITTNPNRRAFFITSGAPRHSLSLRRNESNADWFFHRPLSARGNVCADLIYFLPTRVRPECRGGCLYGGPGEA
jgi:hypothetical protein